MGRLLAFDIGEVVIGVAVSDDRHVLATPLKPIVRRQGSMALGSFRRLFEEYLPERALVGIPRQTDKGLSQPARRIKAFVEKLRRHFPEVEFEWRDERLSTWSVKEKYARLSLTKNNGETNLDSFSAMEMLEDYFKEKGQAPMGG
ncbi:MAG: Holliday junction resolvase RuvX [Spirochaetes bacterium]|nr:Holliday junction resolvase RuvX [Spirochaetota bacterium]